MLHIRKVQGTAGRWTWQIGRVALASASPAAGEPGLFYFRISGVHRQGAELFSRHARAEALLKRHLGCDATLDIRAISQSIEIARDDRWHKPEPADSPERENDGYTYAIGNVLLASLTNDKHIRHNGYRLYIPLAGGTAPTTVLSISAGEQMLIEALECSVSIQRRAVSYVVGVQDHPGEADWFSCQPTLYDGRPAW
jgi:hypothetical protein